MLSIRYSDDFEEEKKRCLFSQSVQCFIERVKLNRNDERKKTLFVRTKRVTKKHKYKIHCNDLWCQENWSMGYCKSTFVNAIKG